jgi:hypothetical protein
MMAEIHMATCPCCKGEGVLLVYSADEPPHRGHCTHCDGRGQIEQKERATIELESMTETEIFGRYSTPGLRKCELARAAKKDHLASIGVKNDDATKVLDQLYPPKGFDRA